MHSTNFHSTQSHVSKSLKVRVCVRVFVFCFLHVFACVLCFFLRSPFSSLKLVESWAQDRILDTSSTSSYFSPPMTTTQRRCVWVGRLLWRSGAWFRMLQASKCLKHPKLIHTIDQHQLTRSNQNQPKNPKTTCHLLVIAFVMAKCGSSIHWVCLAIGWKRQHCRLVATAMICNDFKKLYNHRPLSSASSVTWNAKSVSYSKDLSLD